MGKKKTNQPNKHNYPHWGRTARDHRRGELPGQQRREQPPLLDARGTPEPRSPPPRVLARLPDGSTVPGAPQRRTARAVPLPAPLQTREVRPARLGTRHATGQGGTPEPGASWAALPRSRRRRLTRRLALSPAALAMRWSSAYFSASRGCSEASAMIATPTGLPAARQPTRLAPPPPFELARCASPLAGPQNGA